MPYHLTRYDLDGAWAVVDIQQDKIDVMHNSEIDARQHAAEQNEGYPQARYAAVRLTLLPE